MRIQQNQFLNYRTTKSGFQYAIKETILKVENVSLTYDKLIFVYPDSPIISDGIRSTDVKFQKNINYILSVWSESYNPIKIKSSVPVFLI